MMTPNKRRRTASLSFSAPRWIEEMAKVRSDELGMNMSQYIRYLIEDDLRGGGSDFEVVARKPQGAITDTSFLSFSADSTLERMINERAAKLRMTRSWYVRSLIQADKGHEGGKMTIKKDSALRIVPRTGRRGGGAPKAR